MNIKGVYTRLTLEQWAFATTSPESLSESFVQERRYPIKLGSIAEIGMQPLVRFGKGRAQVQLKNANPLTSLIYSIF